MDDLYRQVIIDRYQSPRNRHSLPDANASEHSQNPLCGDEMSVSARIEDRILADLAFEARGCSISQASADMMVDLLRGRSLSDVERLASLFRSMMEDGVEDAQTLDELGDLTVLRSVRKYPVRIKCALLSWNTLGVALQKHGGATAAVTR